ncbi:hypothetical protein BJ878DRAFT_582175 [Calycina marina]|uniref:Uncharacterized protein n=1 Tax=Calycina marina TaxID=1763456 RepID=A0A9P7Z3W5_9HELO|nr:hypothetical protein BJ878DRAFT_582175 [Calycina marina]
MFRTAIPSALWLYAKDIRGAVKLLTKASVGDDTADIIVLYCVNPETVQDLGETAYAIGYHGERFPHCKFDIRLLPVLALMYLLNALDKEDFGNVKSAKPGPGTTLYFRSNQYNIISSVFYVPYVLFAPPIVSSARKEIWTKHALPLVMLAFGPMTVLNVVATNFSGMMALKCFFGMAKSAFFPLVIYYLTTSYRRGELTRRLAMFYATSNIANAFSGLLVSFGSVGKGANYSTPVVTFLAIEICLGIPLQSVSLFLPKITNLYTVAPNIGGAAMLLILAFSSKYTRRRGPFMVLGFFLSFCGFIIYAAIDVLERKMIEYFACFMMCGALQHRRHVVPILVGVPLANVVSLVSSNVFTPASAPNYIRALAAIAAFGAASVLIAMLLDC